MPNQTQTWPGFRRCSNAFHSNPKVSRSGFASGYPRPMPRRKRGQTGGYVFHVLNRAVGRKRIFREPADFAAFEGALIEASDRVPMRLLAYCIMPNHWHLVLWPRGDGELSAFMHFLSGLHAQGWHRFHGTVGTGPLYQGRFKSFPVEGENHLIRVCRYVERNPLRAGLVRRAEEWRWSSLGMSRTSGPGPRLEHWPIDRPEPWDAVVNEPQTEAELAAIRESVVRGSPFGCASWRESAARALGLESSLRSPGRPKKRTEKAVVDKGRNQGLPPPKRTEP